MPTIYKWRMMNFKVCIKKFYMLLFDNLIKFEYFDVDNILID